MSANNKNVKHILIYIYQVYYQINYQVELFEVHATGK